MKKLTLAAIALSAILGCTSPERADLSQTRIETPVPSRASAQRVASYELSNLCDTELYEKELNLYIYIEPSRRLWDYHQYKDEIMDYVSAFFKNQNIKCNIHYSKKPFVVFETPNEVGIEILSSNERMTSRYFQLFPPENKEKEKNMRITLSSKVGYAAPEAGFALMDGCNEEFRGASIKEQKLFFSEQCGKRTVKEEVLRSNASHICHEMLHCIGLFHPNATEPRIVEDHRDEIPNIMTHLNAKFSDNYPVGYTMTELQIKLLHSYIAGNNTYIAFIAVNRELSSFLLSIAKANNFVVVEADKRQ